MATADPACSSSDEVLHETCEVCMEDNDEAREPVAYCCECRQYLCKACSDVHRAVRATRAHNLLSETDLPVSPPTLSASPLMLCENHVTEPVKVFCQEHNVACCMTCAVLTHRHCTEVTELAELAAGVKESRFYSDTLKLYSDLKKEVRVLRVSQSKRLTIEKECCRPLNLAIHNFQQNMRLSIAPKKETIASCERLKEELNSKLQDVKTAINSFPEVMAFLYLKRQTELNEVISYNDKVERVVAVAKEQTGALSQSEQDLMSVLKKLST